MDRFARGNVTKASIKQLERRLAEKKREVTSLLEHTNQLSARHLILLAYCNSLAWLREYTWHQITEGSSQQQQQQQELLSVVHSMRLAGTEELLLLEQLGLHPQQQQQLQPAAGIDHNACDSRCYNSHAADREWLLAEQQSLRHTPSVTTSRSRNLLSQPDNGSSATIAASLGGAAAAGHGPATISPHDDVLALFRHVHSLPPFPGAAHMTSQQVAEVYNDIVRDLSLQLVLYEARLKQQPATPLPQSTPSEQFLLDHMKAAFDRYFNMMITLLQLGNGQLIMSIGLMNFVNPLGEMLQEPNVEAHFQAVARMGLSMQQQQQIAEGMNVFSRLLEPVLQELRQLQLQDVSCQDDTKTCNTQASTGNNSLPIAAAAATGRGGGRGVHPSSSSNGSGSGRPSLSVRSEVGTAEHREQVHQQEQRTARMAFLMQKDALIKAGFVCYTFGRFTYPQLAKLHCIMFPYNPHHATVVKVVVQQLKQAKQQQQQQQQQKPGNDSEQQQQQAEPAVVVQLVKQQQQVKSQLQKHRKKRNVAR